MKISVVLYLFNRTEDLIIYRSLGLAGFNVCQIGNLSRLHTILESRSFDAVILKEAFLACHCVEPKRHLRDARSNHTIITWKAQPDGSLIAASFNVPPSESTAPIVIGVKNDQAEKTKAILEVLSNIRMQENWEPTNGSQNSDIPNVPLQTQICAPPVFPNDEEARMHHKIRLVLNTLIAASSTGIDTETISEKVWGPRSGDKTKDIQIYISKLRGILRRSFHTRYAIRYERKRYFLTETHQS